MSAKVFDPALDEGEEAAAEAWEGDVYVFPVSFAQQRLWFLEQFEPGTPAYHIPLSARITGRLDVGALRRALEEIVARHESLRTTFTVEEGEPVQVIADGADVRLPLTDLAHLDPAEREAELAERLEADARRAFDLEKGPLFRARLYRLAAEEHALSLVMHHIVSDGWSMGVLFRELAALYDAFSSGREAPLDPLPIQYADYAVWQREHLAGEELERQLAYWRERLKGVPTLLELPYDRPRPPRQRHRGLAVGRAYPRELGERLVAFARGEGATLFIASLAAFQLLLQRYSGQDDFVVGTPVAGRSRSKTEGLIGFFVNTLALRSDVAGDPTFRELVRRVREGLLDAHRHEDVPFEKLVEELRVERSLSHAPLFQVMFAAQAEPNRMALPGLALQMEETEAGIAKFDLSVAVRESAAGFGAYFRYNTDLFDAATVEGMSAHYRALLEAALARPDVPVSELLLPASPRAFPAPVDAAAAGAATLSLHHLFEAQVRRAPRAVAVESDDRTVTYGELDAAASRLARRLRALGAGRETRVGVVAGRTPEMVCGLLGILKAGAAYVPLDPNYPAERLAFMLEDAGVSLLLAETALLDRLPGHALPVVPLDGVLEEGAEDGPPFADRSRAGDLAYVIYTSGSTGRPKGVLVEHRGVCNLVAAQGPQLGAGPGERMYMGAPLSFDASVAEIFQALCHGATLCPAPADAMPGAELAGWLAERGITIARISPSALGALPAVDLPDLHTVGVGGEACPPDLVARWASPKRRFFNLYGPTETTVRATASVVEPDGRTPAIGVPVPNCTAYVLDARLRPLPAGVPGELCIGGTGVTRGYHGRPGLTAERFVPDPFSAEPGARMYRTGDRARLRHDGELEFLGRLDEQVKVRGYRIEPGEIEAALRALPGVRDAVVAAVPDATGERVLAGYVVPADPSAPPSLPDLRAELRSHLPEYLVPTHLALLEAVPIGPSGKVDRRSLPAPTAVGGGEEGHVEPRTETERRIAHIWTAVLGVEAPGVHDDFFASGGHSLRATQLVSRVREQLRVELPLRTLFEEPTIAGLAGRVDAVLGTSARAGDDGAPPLGPVARDIPLPLSFAQERLWFLDQMEPGLTAYNMPLAVRLQGRLDVAALKRTLAELVRRHESLRTVFSEVNRVPVQVVRPAGEVPLPFADLSRLPREARPAEVSRRLAAEGTTPFDLARGPLFRAQLVRLDDDDHALLLTLHHIVTDGWGNGVLFREMGQVYAAFAAGLPSPLPEPVLQYADFAAWQRKWLVGEALEAQVAWWKERLKGAPAVLELPADRPRPPVQRYRGGVVQTLFPRETQDAVAALTRAEGATVFMALLAAFQALLFRHSGQEDVVVGSPIANRTREQTEGMVGFFVNTLALRTDLSGDPTFRELLARVREVTLGAFAHQDLPFERLVEEVQPERSLAYSPVFQVMFALQNADAEPPAMPGLATSRFGVDAGAALFDLSLFTREGPDGLLAAVQYAEDLFDRATAERILHRFGMLAAAAAAHPDTPISALPMLAKEERELVVRAWNATDVARPAGECVHHLFEAQAARTPDAEAVRFGGRSLSYAEVEAAGNRLAHHLRALGVGPESRVGICLERSADVVVAVLGTLKAGAAYVAMDPNYPEDRLAHMLRDSRAAVLLTSDAVSRILPPHDARVVRVDTDAGEIAGHPSSRVESGATPDNLAYVLYTSGSTGLPKGAALPHRALVNLLRWQLGRWAGQGPARTLQFASLSFDVSFQEIFSTWASGGTLVLVSDETRRDPDTLLPYLGEHGVERLFLPFVALQHVAEQAEARGVHLPALREVITAGEQLQATPQLRAFFRRHAGCVLENQYGPSEAHVVSAHRLAKDPEAWPLLPPIGGPIENTRLYVLDAGMRPAGLGVPGELYIGGECLARGYLLRPSLTAEKFVPSPFGDGERLYRTGDLARWTAEGVLQFHGRIDHQVKVRGYRVELGEIEASLLQHPGVREAAVMLREPHPGDRKLFAWVSPNPGHELRATELRAHLKARLPEFMVPAVFSVLEALPLSPNGKVDRRALPDPEPGSEHARALPRTPTEEVVAAIWAEVLHLDWMGTDENFFDLGGHSLKATQVMSRLREVFHADLPLRVLFEAPTVAELAGRIDAARGSDHRLPPIEPVERGGDLPLSFAQARMWFLDRMETSAAAYNVPLALRLQGRLDVEALRRAVAAVVERHESLRTTFPTVDGEPVQRISPEPAVELREFAWTPAGPVAARLGEGGGVATTVSRMMLDGVQLPVYAAPGIDDAQAAVAGSPLSGPGPDAALVAFLDHETRARFDLAAGPLARAALLRVSAEEHVFVLTLHHIVSDGWSIGVLTHELSALYGAFARGEPSPLPPLSVQYADYAAWQRRHLSGEELERQVGFWKEHLSGAPAVLELPADHPRPAVQSFRGAVHAFPLGMELSVSVHHLSRREGATPFMTLLAAFKVLLARYSGQDDVVVGTAIAARTRPETEPLVGFFVNTLALRTDLGDDPTFRELVGRVRGTMLDAHAHQEVPFEKLVDELEVERSLSHTPIFQVMFALQNAPMLHLELPGLEAHPLGTASETTKFDLTFTVVETPEGLHAAMQYSTDLFEPATIAGMAEHFRALLASAVDAPATRVSQLSLLPAHERETLAAWNEAARRDYPRGLLVHRLFEAQVDRTPDAVAVVWNGRRVSYRELDERANRLAHRLRRLGVGPDVLVGVCMERTPAMVIALYAVLKAGGAYVPVDPAYPAERIGYMLDDTDAPVLITEDGLLDGVPQHGATLLKMDEEWAGIAGTEPATRPDAPTSPGNLAYAIYTSGSTGRPKGVAIEHRSTCTVLQWLREHVSDEDRQAVLASTSISFDVSVAEIFGTLSWGGTIVLVENALALAHLPPEQPVYLASMVPSAAAELLRSYGVPESVRTMSLGGEALPSWVAQGLYGLGHVRTVSNLYGPTEDTTYSTWSVVQKGGRRVFVGRPVANTQLHVLDAHLQPVPIGVPGDLYLAGDGLARGYLNRPEMTAERWVPNPFGPAGSRMFRVMDRVRFHPGGELEFMERLDHQVKVRGYRVEPGEIETVLAAHPAVREAVVVLREDVPGDRRLVAYLVPVFGEAPTASELRGHVADRLPDYMVPSAFVLLEALPQTPNGKLDRRSLPSPDQARPELEHVFVAPESPLEQELAGIWCEVLKVERVGVDDNFFDLGGHSLLLAQMHGKVRQEMGREVTMVALFKYPTIRMLAEHLAGAGGDDESAQRGQSRAEARLGARSRRRGR